MGDVINLQAVYVTDLVGIAILLSILASRGWNLPARKEESRIIASLLVVSIFNCISDIYVFACDGMEGPVYYWILMVGNTYLYLYNLIVGIGIIYLIIKHIDHQAKGWHIIIFWSLIIIEASMLIINFFVPIVFGIDGNNEYYRGPYYLMFVFVGFGLIIYGYAYYIINKIKNPSLRYFPVIGFLLPVFIGNAVQMQIYGISLLPISFTVAFAAITISLQNECIYIDKLTGVYNRYELDKILRKGFRRKNLKIAALMLDLNDFKAINDNYSHEEGDEALVAFATILADTIRAEGVVIRFAGDEFIVIMPKFQDVDISEYEARIHAGLDAYNESSGKPYTLSAAIGGKVFDPRTDNMDSVLKDIDALMYSAKREYYSKHDRRHNRSPQPAAQS